MNYFIFCFCYFNDVKVTSKNPSVSPAGCHLPKRGGLKSDLISEEEGVGVTDGRRYKSAFLEMPIKFSLFPLLLFYDNFSPVSLAIFCI